MKISTLIYSLKQGVKNIRRNLIFSLASVGTIVACLFLFGIFYAIVMNFDAAVKEVESTVSISVFFNEGMTLDEITAIGEQLRLKEEINTIEFISSDQAWATFVEENYDDPNMAFEAFGEDNPLVNSSSYEITLKDISKQEEFVAYLEGIEGIRRVNSSEAMAMNLTSLNSLVGYASIAIVIILLLVSIFLISNTITIGITVRKEEIAIMKLIGATDFFVRAPFMVEGVIIGLVGSVIPVAILYFMYNNVVEYLLGQFQVLSAFMSFVPTNDIFKILAPLSIGIGVGIGFFGSLITTFKHLKV